MMSKTFLLTVVYSPLTMQQLIWRHFCVALRHGRQSLDDVIEAELAEDGVEAAPPLAVVGVQEIEKDGDV